MSERVEHEGKFYYLEEEENLDKPILSWIQDEVENELMCDCGNKQWVVGIGQYYTAAICTHCKREFCVHTG